MRTAATSPTSPATEMVVAGGHHVRVALRPGRGDGTPLLLLNGLGVPLEGLGPFVEALSPDRSLIRFDIPGVGGSPAPRRPYRLGEMVRLVGHLLDELGVARVDALGVSWGGALAQQFALARPRRCRRLVLVSTAPGALLPPRPTVLREMLTGRRFVDDKHLLAIAPRLYGGAIRADPDRARAIERARPSRRGLLYQQLALLGWTSVPFLHRLRQPTLVLAGDDDPIIPLAMGRLLRALIPRAQLHVFHDGHLGLLTSAGELSQVIEGFLDADRRAEPAATAPASARAAA